MLSQVRVEWLRQGWSPSVSLTFRRPVRFAGRLPKLGAYWADAVERSLGGEFRKSE